MSSRPGIAIVGGGPAGLTAAVILHRAGHQVCVYEGDSSERQRLQGGTLDLHADSGQLALRCAGLLEAFQAVARHEDQEERMVDPHTGEAVAGRMGPEGEIDRPEIDRGALRDLLLNALPDDVVRWGYRLDRIESGAVHRHSLVFMNGARSEADIVIGADGAWSKVRPFLTPLKPSYTGITFFEGWIDKPRTEIAELVGHGTLFCFGGEEALFAQRNGGGRICVYAAVKRPSDWLNAQVEKHGASKLMAGIYDSWAPNLRQLLSSCGAFVARPIYSLPADFAWTPRKGVTLIGDAAHLMPPVGVGVNLAMLDASDLVSEIVRESEWENALRSAEAGIRMRAKGIMPRALAGFQEWFSPRNSQRLRRKRPAEAALTLSLDQFEASGVAMSMRHGSNSSIRLIG